MIKRTGATTQQVDSMYQSESSFVNMLPWIDAEDDCILLEDGHSVGAVYEIKPKGTEGRSADYLSESRDAIAALVHNVFPGMDDSPWVIQTYTFKEGELSGFMKSVEDYVAPNAKGTQYTEHYIDMMKQHCDDVCQPGGLFKDNRVTQTEWGGCELRSYVVIYRRITPQVTKGWLAGMRNKLNESFDTKSQVDSLNNRCKQFVDGLNECGVTSRRLSGEEFHKWMTRWFNMYTTAEPDNPLGLVKKIEEGGESVPYGDRFTESMFYSYPVSDLDGRYWRFDKTYSRCLNGEGFNRKPAIGESTGEVIRHKGGAVNTLMDVLPPGSVMVTTIVVVARDTVENEIEIVDRLSIGNSIDAVKSRGDCDKARDIMGSGNEMLRAKYAFYINANSEKQLNDRTDEARMKILSRGMQIMEHTDDARSLNSYINNLPMQYDADKDRDSRWSQAKLTWSQHIANFSCFFGRSTGTGNPNFTFWNRGGEPQTLDPMGKDRQSNGNCLLIGPAGAGKSVTLAGMIASAMAMYRPRVFLIEAGNSFGLFGQWMARLGVGVNSIVIKPGGDDVALPIFQDAYKALLETPDPETVTADDFIEDDSDDDLADEKNDVLESMTISAILMATGGEEKELFNLSRPDKAYLRKSILYAAKATEPGETLTQDVRDALYALAEEEKNPDQKQRVRNLAMSMGYFCEGLTGQVFNRKAKPWAETDLTLINLGYFARAGYETHLAIAMISVMSMINDIAERDQHLGRKIVVAIDEAHTFTVNELLSPHLAKISKMWRKLGVVLWLATQNMKDFPKVSQKLLSMIEWWICLVMPKPEIEQVRDYKELSAEQIALMRSANKESGKYTEGVILSPNLNTIIRSVPPAALFGLTMSENEEKAERRDLMEEFGLDDEVDAALLVAKRLEEKRRGATI